MVNTLSRLIYFTNLSSTALVHRLENRPIQSGNSCIPTNMEQPSRLLLPVILSYFSSFNKSRPESDRKEVACPTKEVLYLGSKTSLVTPIQQSHVWYPLLIEMSVAPTLLRTRNIALKNPRGKTHPLVTNRTLHLAALAIHEKNLLRKRSNRIKTRLLLGYTKPHVKVNS